MYMQQSVAGLEFPWNQSTAMVLKIAVERVTAVYGNFDSFHGIFQITVILKL
jgi:hypothetical protein